MNPTISNMLLLRIKQSKRIMQDIGFVYLLLLSPLVFIMVLKTWEYFATTEIPYLPGLIVTALFLSIHLNRKDGQFLPRLSVPPPLICFAEYFLFLIPILLLSITAGNWQSPLIALLGIALISWIPPGFFRSPAKNRWDLSPIPLAAFEWRSGFRKYIFIFGTFYLIGIGLSFFTVTLPIVAFLFSTLFMTFYEELEAKELIETFAEGKPFLWSKIKLHSWMLHLFMLPLYLLFLFFHGPFWYILAFIMVYLQSMILFSIFHKYAFYRPKRRKVSASVANTIFMISALFPLTFPISIAMLFIYGHKAKVNLAQYYA